LFLNLNSFHIKLTPPCPLRDCFGIRVSGLGIRDSGFEFRVLSFGCRVLDFGFRVSGFGIRVAGSGFWISGFGFRVSGFGIRVAGSVFQVSGFGFGVSGSEFRACVLRVGVGAFIVFRVQSFGSNPCLCSRCRANSAHIRQLRPDSGLLLSNFSFQSLHNLWLQSRHDRPLPPCPVRDCFGFRVSGFGIRVSSFGFWV